MTVIVLVLGCQLLHRSWNIPVPLIYYQCDSLTCIRQCPTNLLQIFDLKKILSIGTDRKNIRLESQIFQVSFSQLSGTNIAAISLFGSFCILSWHLAVQASWRTNNVNQFGSFDGGECWLNMLRCEDDDKIMYTYPLPLLCVQLPSHRIRYY